MHLSRLLLIGFCLVLAGCDPPVGLSGVWTGSTSAQVGGFSFNLTLTESEQGVVAGAGRFINPNSLTSPFSAVNVTGAHAHPAVNLHILFSGNTVPTSFSGTLDRTLTVMRGALFGSGFTGDSIRLVRNTPAISGRITAP